jgi:hypothetical protein
MNRFGSDVRVSSAIAPAAGVAGLTLLNGSILDMAGFRALAVLVTFGPIVGTAVTSIKLQQGNDSGLSDAADVAGTNQTIADADDEKTFFIDASRLSKRYVRLVVSRGTANATIANALYLQYDARRLPVTHGANVAGESFSVPLEGTP